MITSSLLLVSTIVCFGLLSACGGSGSQSSGISAMTQTTYMTSTTANGDVNNETDPAAEDSSIKPMYRDDNMYIELQLGLVNLRAVELVKCESVATSAARRLLDFVLPSAHAHAAHIPSGPAGVIDVLKPDLLVWDLGELYPSAASYCGIKLEIANVEGSHDDGHGDEGEHHEMGGEEESGLNMAGKGVLVSPCYYPDTAGSPQSPLDSTSPHTCIEAAYTGDAVQHTVLFAEPVSLGSDQRSVHLMLATTYDNWFNGLDMTTLEDSESEQTKLAQNVLESFYLYSAE